MEEVHPFTVRIEADPLNKRRLCWTICEGNPIVIRSPYSYVTRREANKEANEMLLIDMLRNGAASDDQAPQTPARSEPMGETHGRYRDRRGQ